MFFRFLLNFAYLNISGCASAEKDTINIYQKSYVIFVTVCMSDIHVYQRILHCRHASSREMDKPAV